ncbi:hypothetical protein SO694_00105098 [Aureococcus anophagefferens]|uniref:Uncharacterized protein n=1 Tax=Aureococcus anophagefferens TaxID=44056 RepID=A0ABR1FMA0_AURAN
MIWPDIFELCNVREKVAIALDFDGVPVAVGASPVYATASDDEAVVFVGFYPPVTQADALKFADDVALDPAAAMETLMAGRQMVSGVDFSHLVLVGTNLSFPPALRDGRVRLPPADGARATDAPCDECRALGHTTANGRLRACRRSLEAKAQCRRFAVLVVTADGEHSAAVNACNEYVAAFVDGSVPQPLEALISAAPGLREFLRAERPLCLVDFVHSLRRIWGKSQDYFLLSGDELVSTHLLMALRSFAARPHEWVKHLSTKALRAKNRLCSQSVTYLVWKKDLRHNLVRSPCALACATKSTLVFVVTREGSVLAVTNKQPATVSLVAGSGALATTPATAVPKKASTKRSAPGALALVNPTGVAMFDNDRYLVVADFGQPAALIVVEYRAAAASSPSTSRTAFSAKAYGAPFDQSWTIWGITEALVTLPDGGGAAAPAHETAPRVVVGALNGSRLVACDPSGVANVLLAGGDVAGDRDGALPHAQLDQPLGLLLLLDDAFAELVHGGETGLTAAQLDASTSMLDVVTTHAERFNAQQRQAQVNSSAAELGTAADVVALEPRAIEDALQNGSRTTWDTRKPGDGKTFYVTPEGGKAVVVVLAPASAYYDHCFVCRRRVATLWRCAHCVKSLCREHAKAADDGPPSASWTCGKARGSAAKRDFAEHRREIQDRWSLYQITGRGGVGLYRRARGAALDALFRGDDDGDGGDDDDDADTLYFLGREPGGKDHPHGAPERARLPGPHAKRVADFVAAALHVDDDDDDDEEEEEEGEGDDGDDDDDDDDDDAGPRAATEPGGRGGRAVARGRARPPAAQLQH